MKPLLSILAAVSLHAATIHGNVVEHQSGKPLSRVLVKLLPLPGVAAQPVTARTNTYGAFEFSNVPAGAYMVTASRKNFVTVQYGQKQWNSAGEPIVLDDSASTFLNIRMPHFAAINGRVVDENDVGIPHQPVVAYRNTRPPQLAARAVANEKGEFRIYGLEAGSYLVRSTPLDTTEISYLPTFAKDTTQADDARVVEVTLDQEADGVEIRPIPGTLIPVFGRVDVSMPPVTVTFASDMGREAEQTDGAFRFAPVPPGAYDLYAEGPGDGTARCPAVGAWEEVDLRRPHPLGLTATCISPSFVSVVGAGGRQVDVSRFKLYARRVDKAGPGQVRELPVQGRRAFLLPGRWQVMLETPPEYYVSGFSPSYVNPGKHRFDGWNDVIAYSGAYLQFTVSGSPGGVHGAVTGTSHETVAGAPVFLETIDSMTGARTGELRSTMTDTRGQYHFRGLAPGEYHILATFEYQAPDAQTMAQARPQSVSVQEGGDVQQDLDLFVLP